MSSLKVRPGWGGLNIELINTSVVIPVVHRDGIAVFKTSQARGMSGLDPGTRAGLEEALNAFVPEACVP
jgi:hypothetical protein